MFQFLNHTCLQNFINSNGVRKILQNSPCLKYLQLSSEAIDRNVDDLPMFEQLTCLEVGYMWPVGKTKL
ncbi:hypothetical protein C1H46_019782 [Malus baccata]|uniref:Uncharacterized protein n=1 Tax=Malus baccata TaxID=106549 RepID=A0A540M704_MALBA|nr:hypothetical protein C1H46_019782 [Malus baccata]